MIGHAPGETVKGGREKGGNASPPGDSRMSRRIHPLALLILHFFFIKTYHKRRRAALPCNSSSDQLSATARITVQQMHRRENALTQRNAQSDTLRTYCCAFNARLSPLVHTHSRRRWRTAAFHARFTKTHTFWPDAQHGMEPSNHLLNASICHDGHHAILPRKEQHTAPIRANVHW
eukprot:scaffold30508_cov119-Isochrysis_galbana.AAC.1